MIRIAFGNMTLKSCLTDNDDKDDNSLFQVCIIVESQKEIDLNFITCLLILSKMWLSCFFEGKSQRATILQKIQIGIE
jgi:hypothetical protein